MKLKLMIGISIVLFLTLMMPVVHPIEYQTVNKVRESYIKNLFKDDIDEQFEKSFFSKINEKSGSLFLKVLKIKWILFIIFKLAFLPLQIFIKNTAEKIASTLKILLAPFWIPTRLLLYTLRFITAPVRIVLVSILSPIILIAKLISIPFQILDVILFILYPFRHPLIDD